MNETAPSSGLALRPGTPRRRLLRRLVSAAVVSAAVSLALAPFLTRFVGLPLDMPQIVLAAVVPLVVAPLVAYRNARLTMLLEEERARVRELTGLLPICAWCRKIRDDAGAWHTVERFLALRSRAAFTHSVCPHCMAEHFSETTPGEPEPRA